MKKNFPWLLLLWLCGLAHGEGLGKIQGVQLPEKILEFPRKDLYSASEKPAVQRCHMFANFAAVEIDTGEIGANAMVLRWPKPGKKVEKLCAAKNIPEEIHLCGEEHYVLGVTGHFIFVRSADGFGDEREMQIFDAVTGEKIYKAAYQESQDFLVVPREKTLSLDYYARLSLHCNLAQAKCWDETLSENKIPSMVKLQKPNCRSVFQSQEFKQNPKLVSEPRAIQLFARVRVEDVRNAVPVYTKNPVLCVGAP